MIKGKQFGKLFGKIVCIFDDIPFVLRGLLKDAEAIGSFLLGGAGALVFLFELKEGIHQFLGAYKKKQASNRKEMLAAGFSKIVLSVLGLGVSAAIITLTVLAIETLSSVFSVFVPGIMAVITGIELFQKKSKLAELEKNRLLHPANSAERAEIEAKIIKTKRAGVFAAVYFGIASVVASLALLSTLSALSVVTLGIAPSVALIAVVTIAASIKIFEMIDSKRGFPACNAIQQYYTNKISPTLKRGLDSTAKMMNVIGKKSERTVESVFTSARSEEVSSQSKALVKSNSTPVINQSCRDEEPVLEPMRAYSLR